MTTMMVMIMMMKMMLLLRGGGGGLRGVDRMVGVIGNTCGTVMISSSSDIPTHQHIVRQNWLAYTRQAIVVDGCEALGPGRVGRPRRLWVRRADQPVVRACG